MSNSCDNKQNNLSGVRNGMRLHWCIRNDFIKEAIQLIKNNPKSVNIKDYYQATPLMLTALIDNDQDRMLLLNALIKNSADIALTDIFGDNVFHYAARNNRVDIIETLWSIKKETIIDAPNKENKTPLLKALYSKSLEAAEWLIKNGANLSQIDHLGFNVIHCALDVTASRTCEQRLSVLRMVIKHLQPTGNLKSVINAESKYYGAPLKYVVDRNTFFTPETTQLLTNNGAKIENLSNYEPDNSETNIMPDLIKKKNKETIIKTNIKNIKKK